MMWHKTFYQAVAALVVFFALLLIGLSLFHRVELEPDMQAKLFGMIEIAFGAGLYKDAGAEAAT